MPSQHEKTHVKIAFLRPLSAHVMGLLRSIFLVAVIFARSGCYSSLMWWGDMAVQHVTP